MTIKKILESETRLSHWTNPSNKTIVRTDNSLLANIRDNITYYIWNRRWDIMTICFHQFNLTRTPRINELANFLPQADTPLRIVLSGLRNYQKEMRVLASTKYVSWSENIVNDLFRFWCVFTAMRIVFFCSCDEVRTHNAWRNSYSDFLQM